MGRDLRIGLFFVFIVVFIPRGSWADKSQPAAVRVVLHDSASVGEATLAEAREFSAAVFRAAGGTARAFCVQVLLRPHHPQFEPGRVRTMGVALAADVHRAVVSVYLDA